VIWLALVLTLAPPVTLTVDACADVSEPEVRRLVELELLSTRASITGLSALVECRGPELGIRVEDPLTGKTLERTVDLARAAPNAKARLLALAIVEVVEANWSEQLFAPVILPQPSPLPEANRTTVAAPAPAPLGNIRLTLTATSRALVASPLWQWGGGVRMVHTPFRFLGWAAELTGEQGTFETGLGSVQISSGGAALEILGQLELGMVTLQLGGGARGGIVNARGIPRVPLVVGKDLTGPWAGAFVALSASLGLGWWLLSARLEGGSVIHGLPAHVESVNTGMDGPLVGLALGFGIRP
jgi:hypothetical protein